jgi:Tol biopolymer transport system component
MKHLLLTIGSFFSSMLFVQSQTLYGTTFYGGSAQGGGICAANPTNVTNNPNDDTNPAVSADGTKIAFVSIVSLVVNVLKRVRADCNR